MFVKGVVANPKGRGKSKNKLHVDVLTSFYYVYENMDPRKGVKGNDAFLDWGRRNKKHFYEMFSRLLPKKLDIDVDVNKHEDFVRNLAADQLIQEAQAKQVDVNQGPDTIVTLPEIPNGIPVPTTQTSLDMPGIEKPVLVMSDKEKANMPDVLNVKSFSQLKEMRECARTNQETQAKIGPVSIPGKEGKQGLMPSASHEKPKPKVKAKRKRKRKPKVRTLKQIALEKKRKGAASENE